MARIRFQDSDAKVGELDLGKLKPGDLVKFKADFLKRADDADEEKKVTAGEIGEVLEVYPMMPGLLLLVPCELSAMGHKIVGDAELVVAPDDVFAVIDARDPRLSSQRTMEAAAAEDPFAVLSNALSPSELTACVRALPLPSYCLAHRRVVVAALVKADARLAARTIARTTDEAWADFVLGAELSKTAAHISDWLPLVLWAMGAFEKEFPGKSKPSLKNRRHVTWALAQLAEDLASTIPAHPVDWTDEDDETSQLIDDTLELKRLVERSSDEEWVRSLPQLAELMDDPMLERDYRRQMGLPEKPSRRRDETLQQIDDLARSTQGLPPKGMPPPPELAEPAPAPAPEAAPAAPAQLPALAEEPEQLEDLGEIELEPTGQPVPEPSPAPTPPAAPEPGGPLPMTPSRYDVPAFEPERAPHDWAQPPEPSPRVPISVYPGYEAGKAPRSIKIWAEPEMLVENRKTQETGAVVDSLSDDRLMVDVHDPSGLPVSDQPVIWNAMDTRLSPKWEFPVTKLTSDEMAAWRKSRHDVQRGRMGTVVTFDDVYPPTVVTSSSLTL